MQNHDNQEKKGREIMLKVLSSRKYAKQSGFPLRTIRALCRQGVIPCSFVGGGYYVHVEEADKVMKERASNHVEMLNKPYKMKTRLNPNLSFREKLEIFKRSV